MFGVTVSLFFLLLVAATTTAATAALLSAATSECSALPAGSGRNLVLVCA